MRWLAADSRSMSPRPTRRPVFGSSRTPTRVVVERIRDHIVVASASLAKAVTPTAVPVTVVLGSLFVVPSASLTGRGVELVQVDDRNREVARRETPVGRGRSNRDRVARRGIGVQQTRDGDAALFASMANRPPASSSSE